jgi:O-antigen/teichoic acid export membrane protein
MNVERRTLNAILVGTLSFITNFAQNVLLVPIVLRYWNAETYGLWLGILALYGLIQTIDTGHQNYVGNEICKLYSTNDSALKQVLASSIWMAILLGISQFFIVLGLKNC